MYTIQDVREDIAQGLRSDYKLNDDQIIEYHTLRKDKGLDHDKALKKAQSTSVKEYLGDVWGGFTQAVKSGGEIIQRSQEEIAQATQEKGLIGGFKEALTEAPQAILGGGGSIATGLANAFGEAISPVVEPIITKAIESAPEGAKEFVAEQAQGLSEWYAGLDQGTKDSLAVGNNLVNMLGLVLGGSGAGRSLVSQVGKTAGRIGLEGTAKAFDMTVRQPVKTFGPGIKKGIADFAKKAKTRTTTKLAPVGRVAKKGGSMLATGVRGGIVRPVGAVVGGVKKAASATAKAIKPIEFIQAKINDKMPGLLPGLKALNPKSKEILKETLEIAQERGNNVLSDKLVTDPLGRNLMDRIKAVYEMSKASGKEKSRAINSLPQDPIDLSDIKQNYIKALDELKVKIRGGDFVADVEDLQKGKAGKLDFKESIFDDDDFAKSRKDLEWLFTELEKAKTPNQIDTLRQKLFAKLELDKVQPVFTDSAKRVMKKIRDDLRDVFVTLAEKNKGDTRYEDYLKSSTEYARAVSALRTASKALQLEKEDIVNLDNFVEKITRAGEIARRLQGNASGITKDKFDDLLKLSAEIDPSFADIDISTQAKIAIIIEKLLGIEQQNSLMSMVQGGIDNSVVGMASRLLESVGGADKDEIIQTLLKALEISPQNNQSKITINKKVEPQMPIKKQELDPDVEIFENNEMQSYINSITIQDYNLLNNPVSVVNQLYSKFLGETKIGAKKFSSLSENEKNALRNNFIKYFDKELGKDPFGMKVKILEILESPIELQKGVNAELQYETPLRIFSESAINGHRRDVVNNNFPETSFYDLKAKAVQNSQDIKRPKAKQKSKSAAIKELGEQYDYYKEALATETPYYVIRVPSGTAFDKKIQVFTEKLEDYLTEINPLFLFERKGGWGSQYLDLPLKNPLYPDEPAYMTVRIADHPIKGDRSAQDLYDNATMPSLVKVRKDLGNIITAFELYQEN